MHYILYIKKPVVSSAQAGNRKFNQYRNQMKKCVILFVMLFFVAPLQAKDSKIADTPENRSTEADRYLAASPPRDMLVDLVEKMSAQFPPEKQRAFHDLMIKNMDIDKFTLIIRDSMVKHFTAEELAALADFYSSSVGKSAMAKFGNYMADAMPQVQGLMIEAAQKTQKVFPW